MKLSAALTSAVAALALAGGVSGQKCQTLVARKELRSLSSNELARVSWVIRAMKESRWFIWFAYLHTANFNIIHNCEMFFPFHRRFIRDFEEVGQKFDKNFALPYWDELRDYSNPAASAVMSSRILGTNGKGGGSCVQDGNQKGWYMQYPNVHCLKRQYNGGNKINPWYSPEYIQSVLSRSHSMDQLRPGIEFSLHGSIHLSLGGDMMEPNSPNDFVFWVHHANIDRLWSVWQMQDPSRNFWSLNGKQADGSPMTYTTPLSHYGDRAIDVMLLGEKKMCFYYENGSSVSSRRRRGLAKRDSSRAKKCIPRPPVGGNVFVPSGPLPALVEGVFNAVDQLPVNADTYVANHLAKTVPDHILAKWFPTYNDDKTPVASNYQNIVIPPPPTIDETANPTTSAYEEESSSSADEDDYEDESSSDPEAPVPTDHPVVVDSEHLTDSQLYGSLYQIFDSIANITDAAISGLDNLVGPKYPMPNPYPMPAMWVNMHGFSPKEVREQYDLAKEFVNEMNAAGYQSPFAKGAASFI